MLLSKVLEANKKQMKENFREWKKLINSKNPYNMEILASYREEFEPFKSENIEEYREHYIKKHIQNIYNLEMDLTELEIKQFFNQIFV